MYNVDNDCDHDFCHDCCCHGDCRKCGAQDPDYDGHDCVKN